MEWWGWLLLGLVFVRLRHWGGHRRCGKRRHAMHAYRMQGWGPGVLVIDGRRGCGPEWRKRSAKEPESEPVVELSAAEKRERAITELRRRYVADDITVEEYERELDRLLREGV